MTRIGTKAILPTKAGRNPQFNTPVAIQRALAWAIFLASLILLWFRLGQCSRQLFLGWMRRPSRLRSRLRLTAVAMAEHTVNGTSLNVYYPPLPCCTREAFT